MRISADRSKCIAAGMCAMTAAGVFDQDDDGLVDVLQAHPTGTAAADAARAVDLCPSGALTVETDGADSQQALP